MKLQPPEAASILEIQSAIKSTLPATPTTINRQHQQSWYHPKHSPTLQKIHKNPFFKINSDWKTGTHLQLLAVFGGSSFANEHIGNTYQLSCTFQMFSAINFSAVIHSKQDKKHYKKTHVKAAHIQTSRPNRYSSAKDLPLLGPVTTGAAFSGSGSAFSGSSSLSCIAEPAEKKTQDV